MAATAWQLYNSAKKYIGNGTITLGAGVFKMVLAQTASNASTFTLSTYAGIKTIIGNMPVCFSTFAFCFLAESVQRGSCS